MVWIFVMLFVFETVGSPPRQYSFPVIHRGQARHLGQWVEAEVLEYVTRMNPPVVTERRKLTMIRYCQVQVIT